MVGERGHAPVPLALAASLFLDTDYWEASFLRRKAEQMVWTPGMLMDYAIAMLHVLEKHS